VDDTVIPSNYTQEINELKLSLYEFQTKDLGQL